MLTLRKAVAKDVPLILSLVRELAAYEREPRAVSGTEVDLRRDGFSKHRKFRAIIAEWDGKPAGMALFFPYYSTWQGRSGIFLEDLIVRRRFRGRGVGFALMSQLARIANAEGGYGMRWEVHSWNKEAIQFYCRLGANFRQHGRVMQVKDEDLLRLTKTRPSSKRS
jgi:GNAT superfamily N-acetyltransferase